MLDPDVSHTARPLGLGLVGCGRFGDFCLTAFATIPDLELVGVADLDRGRAKAVAAAFAITEYPDYAALLSDELVDVVAINTPIGSRVGKPRRCRWSWHMAATDPN